MQIKKYCQNCGKEVIAQKEFNWIAFLLWNIPLFLLGEVLYYLYFAGIKKYKCMKCGCEL